MLKSLPHLRERKLGNCLRCRDEAERSESVTVSCTCYTFQQTVIGTDYQNDFTSPRYYCTAAGDTPCIDDVIVVWLVSRPPCAQRRDCFGLSEFLQLWQFSWRGRVEKMSPCLAAHMRTWWKWNDVWVKSIGGCWFGWDIISYILLSSDDRMLSND